jgi:hypothetical protein
MDEARIERLIGATPRLAYEDILRHPHLADARKVYLDRFVDLYDDNPFLVRLLIETGRFAVFLMTIVLDAAQDPERRDTWLTIGRLQREMAPPALPARATWTIWSAACAPSGSSSCGRRRRIAGCASCMRPTPRGRAIAPGSPRISCRSQSAIRSTTTRRCCAATRTSICASAAPVCRFCGSARS